MTTREYTPLTLESAVALLVQVSLVPKLRQFAYRDVTVDGQGRGRVTVTTNAAPESIGRWFGEVGATVTQIERIGNEPGYSVWFDFK